MYSHIFQNIYSEFDSQHMSRIMCVCVCVYVCVCTNSFTLGSFKETVHTNKNVQVIQCYDISSDFT